MLTLFHDAIQFLKSGGVAILPLSILSMMALAVALERSFALQRKRVFPNGLAQSVLDLVDKGKTSEAQAICDHSRVSIARILSAGLKGADYPAPQLSQVLEAAGKAERVHLEKRLHILQTVVGVSPLLGLFGTVTGMIKTFHAIRNTGLGVSEQLAGGISEALVSTAVGLTVAIPFFLVARYFSTRIEQYLHEMEDAAQSLWLRLTQPKARNS